MGKWFVGMPQQNAKEFSKRILQEDFARRFSKKNFQKDFSKKFFRKRVAKDIDTTRVKRIELTNKDKIRLRLEKNNYFPQEKKPGFFSILRRTILDYFLPFPPPPPLEDPRNIFSENKNGSEKE